MAEDVARLLIQVSATTELLRSNLTKAEAAVAQFERDTNKRLGKVDANFKGLGKGVGTLKAALGGFATGAISGLIASLSVGAVTSAIRNSLEFAGSLGEVAQSLGVGTKFLQEFRFAATQNGATIEQADTALGKFSITLGKAFSGNKASVDAVRALGLNLEQLRRQTDSERFASFADAIAKIKDPAQRASAAVSIFGKGALAILPTLEQAGAGFRQAVIEAQRFGLVLSDKQIADADKTADKIAKLKQALATKIAGLVADNAQAIGQLASALADLAAQAVGAAGAWLQWRRIQARTRQIRDENRGAEIVNDGGIFGSIKRNTKRPLPKGGRGGGRSPVGSQFRILADAPDRVPSRAPVLDDFVAPRRVGGGSRSRGISRELKEANPLAEQLLETYRDLSTESIDIGHTIRGDWNKGGGEFNDVVEKINARLDDEREQRLDAIRQAAQLEEETQRYLADTFENLFTNGAKGIWRQFKYEGIRAISDALANFILPGRQSSGGGLFGALFSAAGSIFGGSGGSGGIKSIDNIPGRASGGPVSAGQPYIVGEKRPELFVPNISGRIVPKLGGAGGPSINLTVNAPGATAETIVMIRRELANAAPVLVQAASAHTARQFNRPRL